LKQSFWGTKEKRGQLAKEVEIVEATTRGEVEGKLYARGWLKINGLKVREAKNEPSTDNNMD
jgi:hypothetical protein